MIYVIQQGKYYKVGRAKNPKSRLIELQVASPIKLVLVESYGVKREKLIEKRIHQILDDVNTSGEWFLCGIERIRYAVKDAIRDFDPQKITWSGDMITMNKAKICQIMNGKYGFPLWKARYFGLPWPLQKGWKSKIIGMQIPEEDFEKMKCPTKKNA